MRILIDECVDPRVKLLLGDHPAEAVHDKAWDGSEDGRLLDLAQKEFDVFVTIDGNLEFQQNIARFHIGVVVVHVPKNQVSYYRILQKELLLAVQEVQPGQVLHVRVPETG